MLESGFFLDPWEEGNKMCFWHIAGSFGGFAPKSGCDMDIANNHFLLILPNLSELHDSAHWGRNVPTSRPKFKKRKKDNIDPT